MQSDVARLACDAYERAMQEPDAERRSTRLLSVLAAALLLVAVLAWTTRSRHREYGAMAEAGPTSSSAGIVASVGRRVSHGGRYHAEPS